MLNKLKKDLEKVADSKQAKIFQKFLKTGAGEYGEGDIFLGIKVPVTRQIISNYELDLEQIQNLLNSKIHEHRLAALVSLIKKYKEGNKIERGGIFNFYLANAKRINNWDLVDISAPQIVGDYLLENPGIKNILKKLAKSKNIWERRISIISTFAFIRKEKFSEDVLSISAELLGDSEDLIHKAVGWMLRELGKRDRESLKCFLRMNCKKMPRTMLRYAIEKFEAEERKKWLKGEFN